MRHPPEAIEARSQHLRVGKGVLHRRALPLRRGDGAGPVGYIVAGLARLASWNLRAGKARRVPLADENGWLLSALAATASQPRQLHHFPGPPDTHPGSEGRVAGC